MINLNDKGLFRSLFDEIESAGHFLNIVDGLPTASDEIAVQALIDAFSLDRAKSEVCEKVLAIAASKRNKVVASVSPGEMAAWPIKRAEAEQFGKLGDQASCPLLTMEATRRGIKLSDLVAKVNANASRFETAEASIGGTDGMHRDAIAALTTFTDVASYDYSTGWPEV